MLKAASVAWRTLTHGTERWFCEPDGIVAGLRGCCYHHRRQGWRILGYTQSDMGNVGSDVDAIITQAAGTPSLADENVHCLLGR